MTDKTYLGEFEQMVLLAILQARETAYGVRIREELEVHTGRRAARGALYTTLDRLERKALVRSRTGDARSSRGGRPRRYYRLTPEGVDALRASRAALLSLWRGLEADLEAR